VRGDASGDSEDGEDDELLCVIGGKGEGDCIWRGSRSSVGSSFHRHRQNRIERAYDIIIIIIIITFITQRMQPHTSQTTYTMH